MSKFASLEVLASRIGEPVEPTWGAEILQFAKHHNLSVKQCSPAHVDKYTGEALPAGEYAEHFKVHFRDLVAEFKKAKSARIAKSAKAEIAEILDGAETF